MKNRFILIFVVFIQISVYSQNDTIYALDTIISSVRVMSQQDNELRYFYLDTNYNKHTKKISLEKVNRIVYENKTIEVFCDLVSKKKFLSIQEIISVNYGTRDSLWIDPKIYTLVASEIKEYGYIVDALNYMGNEGWKIVNTYSTSDNSYIVEHYILKKEIKK